MAEKFIIIIRRLIFGYGFFLLLIIVGISAELPFIIVVANGMGLIPIDGFPFPYDIYRLASIISVVITLFVGLRWIYFPLQKLDNYLFKLHSKLVKSKKNLLFRFTGILIAIPLFAVVLIPNAVFWIGFGSVLNFLYPGEELSVGIYITIALITGYIWLAIVIGELCPPEVFLRKAILRCRRIFTDWVLEPASPTAASKKRDKSSNCN